jgi:hypothetical protein
MDYEEIYVGFYSKYYIKIELLIKRFFIKRQNQKKVFFNSYNEVFHYLGNDFVNKHSIFNNEELEKLYQIFSKRHSIYSSDEVQEIFENEIRVEYDKIKLSELPVNYNYIKFIKEIALVEVENEISRLLSTNSRLLEMFYKLNDFDEFEIRRNGNLAVEDFPIYRKLAAKLYPETDTSFVQNDVLKIIKTEEVALYDTVCNPNHWNERTFELFNYLIDNYEKNGKVKFINIYKFINDLDSQAYAIRFTHNTYKSFILENFGVKLTKIEVSRYEYESKEMPILRSWEEIFRKSFI